MDQIDAFPEHISMTVMPVKLPEKPDALEYVARHGQVHACIIYQEPNTKRFFVLFCKDKWYQKKTLVDNFKRAVMETKQIPVFQPPVQIPPVTTTSQIILPDPPRPPVQLFLADPPPVQIVLPPVVETLVPILTSMSSVFGDYSQQGIQAPPAHTQESQVLDTVPSIIDKSNDLISFLDHFETGLLAIEQK
ncbi:uncharacterized protein TNCV_768251 [Trichonephila clavipes]|nr:uncharacterized protein TNCV_768251 [Trichonephila clavipes]